MFFKKKKSKVEEIPYGWSGKYASWQQVLKISGGYNQTNILDKVKDAATKVLNGEGEYERDSFVFKDASVNWPLLSIIYKAALEGQGELNVVDFGGSLASLYFQHQKFLKPIEKLSWSVIEQENFVNVGKEIFSQIPSLRFYQTISELDNKLSYQLCILSGVLQYIEKPYEILNEIIDYGFKYLIFDRTAFISNSEDIISIQRVPPHIYEASYPSWFFNFENFNNKITAKYKLIGEFDNGIEPPIPLGNETGYWKGLIYEMK